MSREFHQIIKFCKIYNKQLVLNNKRDILRKVYCSRRCLGPDKERHKKGYKLSIESRNKMKKSHVFKDKSAWLVNLKKGHEHVISHFKNRNNHYSTWGKNKFQWYYF